MVLCNQGPLVRRLISTNLGLNSNPFFFIPLFKSFFQNIFTILWLVSKHQIVDKRNGTKFFLKLSDLKSDFKLTLGYLNQALNNLALQSSNFNHNQSFKKF